MEKKTEQNEIVDWPKSMRTYINNDAREETKNILESIITIPVIDIILEYGFSWYVNILTNEKILRNADFNHCAFKYVDDFRLSRSSLWHFVDLFYKIFPDERDGLYYRHMNEYDEWAEGLYPSDKLNYMINKLHPYILDSSIYSSDINKIVVTINYSRILKIEKKLDSETKHISLSGMMQYICDIFRYVIADTGPILKINEEQYIDEINVNDDSCINNETVYINYEFVDPD